MGESVNIPCLKTPVCN